MSEYEREEDQLEATPEPEYVPPSPGSSGNEKIRMIAGGVIVVLGVAAVIAVFIGSKDRDDDDSLLEPVDNGRSSLSSDRAPGRNMFRGEIPDRPGREEQENVQAERRIAELERMVFEQSEMIAKLVDGREAQERRDRQMAEPMTVFSGSIGSQTPGAAEPVAERGRVADGNVERLLNDAVRSFGGGAGDDEDTRGRGLVGEIQVGSSDLDVAYRRDTASTIRKGSVIHATLESAVDSTLPGNIRAVVNRPVYAFDGSRVLVPKGSRLFGEYASADTQGQGRVFVSWQSITRPDGVQVDFEAGGVDSLGRSGLGGDVDSRFWTRFGGAALLSVIDELGQIATDSDQAEVRVLGGTTGVGQNVVQATLGVPPRITLGQGEPVAVMVRSDLYFGG